VANAVAAAIRSKRNDIVYVPPSVRAVMSGIRYLPKSIRRRLPR